MKVLIMDCESGGTDSDKHSVLSVGAVVGDLDTGEIFEKFEALHKLPSLSDYVVTPEAYEIHQISPEEAFGKGISSEEIASKLIDLFITHGVTIIGGHNFEFDVRMISKKIFKISVEQFNANFTYRHLDSLPPIRLMTKEDIKTGSTLKQVTKMLNIDISDLGKTKYHTALFDAICCFRILRKIRTVMTDKDVVVKLTK